MKRRIKRDRRGRFARVLVTVKGTAIAAMCYGAFIGGFVLYRMANTSETFSVGPVTAQAASAEIFPIGEIKEYDPCGLSDVVCEDERPVPENEVERLIRSYDWISDDAAVAMAECESGMEPDRVGDTALAFRHNGQKYGESYGLFQIRSGGKERSGKVWVRTDDVVRFRWEMFDEKKNIAKAFDMSDGGMNWYPWLNCAFKNGLIKK